MAPKRNAAKVGKQAGGKGKGGKKPQKVESKPPAPKAVASKRKASASPAPSPAKKAAPVKKGRAASPSPAPANRQTRGRSAVTKKVEEPKAASRSKSNNKTQVEEKQGRVTRTVVQEVEEKKSTATRGRSTSKASKAPATPKQKKETPKEKAATPKQKPATPKQKAQTARQRSATPKKKETPKQKASNVKQRSATPKSKAATPRGRSATPKQKAATPKQQTVSPKKAVTPKQKTVSPKSKTASPKPKAVTPKSKQTTPKKKETPVSQQKQNPKRTTSRSRRSNVDEEIEKAETAETVENEPKDSPEEAVVKEDKTEAIETDNKPSSDDSELVTTKDDEEDVESESPEPVPAEKSDDKAEEPLEESEQPSDEADKPSGEAEKSTDVAETPAQEESAENANTVVEGEENETAVKEPDEDIAEEVVEKEDENVEEDQEEIVDQQTEAESAVVQEAAEEKPVEAKEDTQAEEMDTGVDEEDMKEDQAESEQIGSEEKECESAESEQVESVAQSVLKPDSVVEIEDSGDSEEQMEVEADSTSAANNVVTIDEESEDAVIIEAEEVAATSKPVETVQDTVQDGSGDTGEKADKQDVQGVQEISDDDVEEIGITAAPVIEVPDEGVSNAEQPDKDTTITGIEIGEEVVEDLSEPVTNGGSGGESSPRKRKHDEMEDDGVEEIAVKRSRLSTDEQSLENGSKSEEDVAKDFVVIEMSDVPPSKSQEVVASLPTDTVVTNIDKTEPVNPVYNRAFVPNPAFPSVSDSKKFSIVSYNILADCHLLRNDYSFTEQKYLEPDHRLNKIIEELVYLDADVICLQEVDPTFFSEKLYPQLKSAGYEGLHIKRTKDYFNEGEATFYRTNRFTLVDSSSCCLADLVEKELVNGVEPAVQAAVKQYMDLADVLLVTRLKCQLSGQEVTVGNIHVQWGQMKLQDVQCVQVASAVKEIVSKAGSDQYPHVICGDFNSPPLSPGYLVARDGYPSGDDTITGLQQITGLQMPDGTKSLVDKLWPAFQHTSSSLKSVYNEVMGSEPAITSYNGVMKDTVDYIFYSSTSLDGVGVLQTAPPERVQETGGTPNLFFPSDHISLKAVLAFK